METKDKKVVINKCYGGFSLSPKAVLWLHKHGYDGEEFKTPVAKYYSSGRMTKDAKESLKKDLDKWREYKKAKKRDREPQSR